jgi:hypothetical protein
MQRMGTLWGRVEAVWEGQGLYGTSASCMGSFRFCWDALMQLDFLGKMLGCLPRAAIFLLASLAYVEAE